jgi:hypothetical protein
MIYEKFEALTNNRMIASLIGMSKPKFNLLVKAFEEADRSVQQERYQKGEIKKIQVGGDPGHLNTYEKKLFFILYYLKTYPTFDLLGFHFGFSGGHAHTHVTQLLPVLQRALADLKLLPQRTANTPHELRQVIEKYGHIMIDGVECACVRPQDQTEQQARYSGKKKTHGEKPGNQQC